MQPGELSFEEVLRYLDTLVGRRVDIHAWPEKAGEVGVHLAGVVSAIQRLPAPLAAPDDFRYFCQVGDEEGNGFLLSPFSFIYACISIVDPEIDGLFIRVEGGYSIVIEDDRLVWRNGGWVVPGVSR